MTAPRKRRRDPGFSQLAVWIKTPIKNGLQAAAELEGRSQKEILEAALTDYFAKRARSDAQAPAA